MAAVRVPSDGNIVVCLSQHQEVLAHYNTCLAMGKAPQDQEENQQLNYHKVNMIVMISSVPSQALKFYLIWGCYEAYTMVSDY